MNCRFHPAAAREYLQQVEFYRRQHTGLAARFVVAVEEALTRAIEAPQRQRLVADGLWKIALHHFPFSIFFNAQAGCLTVLAVAHHRRRPDYWHSRR